VNANLRLAVLILLAALLSGCARSYKIQTSRGTVIFSTGKPKYAKDRGCFVYKDMNGVERTIPSGSVRQISPASDSPSPTKFNAPAAN